MSRLILAALLVVSLAACTDEGPASGPGTLTVRLVSPHDSEGAAVVLLVGEGLGAVSSVGGIEAYAHAGVGSLQVVLVDPIGGALAFQVALADVTDLPTYVIQEVAGPDDALRADLTGYDLEFVR